MVTFMAKLMRTLLLAVRPLLAFAAVLFPICAGAQAQEDQTFQQASVDFVQAYFREWSSPNAIALGYMDQVFPDRVAYFDKSLDHAALMNAKHRFAERWPERHFAERPGSVDVTCDTQHLCTVRGLVDWECRSQQRHDSVTGTSVFTLQLQDGMAVVAETGFVVSRGRALAWRAPTETTVARITSSEIGASKAAAPIPRAAKSTASEAAVSVLGSELPPSELSPQDLSVPAPAPLAANTAAAPQMPDSHAGSYTNDDIPTLRATYFAQSSDRDWISGWLMAEKIFTGTARSMGPAGGRTLSGLNGHEVHIMQFDTAQGPIACMIGESIPAFAQGSQVRITGIVSIFIDQTMYLTRCSLA